ncbi:6953_t:CDS:2 [Dentiscutata erythropus]|uniref:6953_t:CDS:1 n=1 Tax=Dentiscutata erythropus TaxID=1348616 RepID=A0A9N9JHA8_9GLOM|nr:6953_t:CDS:2 [Dentiscutata erythropus]
MRIETTDNTETTKAWNWNLRKHRNDQNDESLELESSQSPKRQSPESLQTTKLKRRKPGIGIFTSTEIVKARNLYKRRKFKLTTDTEMRIETTDNTETTKLKPTTNTEIAKMTKAWNWNLHKYRNGRNDESLKLESSQSLKWRKPRISTNDESLNLLLILKCELKPLTIPKQQSLNLLSTPK